MSNFYFLERQFPELKVSVEKAEYLTDTDPEMSIIMARKALEQLIKWISDKAINESVKGKTISDLLSTTEFKKIVPHDVLNKMYVVKNVGNSAVHENYKLEQNLAHKVMEDLFAIYTWFFSKFSSFDKQVIKSQKNRDLVENSLVDFDNDECNFTTFSRFEKLAKNGNAEAQYRLGQCLELGKGTDQDFELAFDYYEQSAEQGYALAILKVAKCQMFGLYTWKDYKKAFINLESLNDSKIAEAYYLKGKCLDKGWGVKKDLDLAFNNYVVASELGCSDAQVQVGWCYQNGKGTKANEKRAFYYYQLSSINGNKYGYFQLGDCYRFGIGVEVDDFEAFKNYKIYLDSNIKDSSQYSVDWYDSHVLGIDEYAMEYLADYYFHGIEGKLEKNIVSALEILEKGLLIDSSYAKDRLYTMYLSGELGEYAKNMHIRSTVERLKKIVLEEYPSLSSIKFSL